MKIVSLNNHNTNTNTINVNFNGTIQGLLDNPAVKSFFSEVSPDDVVTIDGADTSAIAGTLGDIEVNDDTVLEVAKFGEAQPQQQAVPTTGHVFVALAGGPSKKVLITNGVTTVKQVLTEKLANAFAMTQTQLQTMNVFVNDAAAGLCAVLNDNDNVVLESRKAGSKGCLDLEIEDELGCVRTYEVDGDMSLEETLDEILDEDEVVDGAYTISEIYAKDNDGEDWDSLTEGTREILLDSPVERFTKVVIYEQFLAPVDEDDDDDEEFTAEGTVAPAQPGSVTVSQAGSCQPIKVAITANTTVKDVVTSSKVLNTLAMSESQIMGMQFHVNDVEVQANAQLHNGDVVVISARSCGSKGC